jgi:hypothetical protein
VRWQEARSVSSFSRRSRMYPTSTPFRAFELWK